MFVNTILILSMVFIIAAISMILSGLKTLEDYEVMVIERLGKFNRILNKKLNFIIPFIDEPKKVFQKQNGSFCESEKIDLRESVYDFPDQKSITKDNVTISGDILIYFQIVNPIHVVYKIKSLPTEIGKSACATFRDIIGGITSNEVLSLHENINEEMKNILDDELNKSGIKINRIEVMNIIIAPWFNFIIIDKIKIKII